MRGVFFRRGQNLVDLALIIGMVGLVFIGMQTYIKRGVQGKVKDFTDYIVSDKQAAAKGEVARTSNFTADSTMISEEFTGGRRRFNGTEVSVTDYKQ